MLPVRQTRRDLGTSVTVLLLLAGCIATEPSAPTPLITAVVPPEAAQGDLVRVEGRKFGDRVERGTLWFGDVDATSGVATWADDAIEVTVPEIEPVETTVMVEARGVESEPFPFVVLPEPVPLILDVQPNSGAPGDEVEILGDHFGDEPTSESGVRFAPGVDADIVSWSNEAIVVTVPESAETGDLVVRTSAGESAPYLFSVGLDVSFATLESEIFVPRCAVGGCHDSATARAQLSLALGEAFSSIVNVPSFEVPTLRRVAPGSPDESYLFIKLTVPVPPVGDPMPLEREPLSADDISRIEAWILAGAPPD